MRTYIDIDDKLLADAMTATGAKTEREAVERGLLALVRLKERETFQQLKGKLRWTGDLERMRLDS